MREFNTTGTTPEALAKRLFHEAYHSTSVIVDAPSKKMKPVTEETNGGGIKLFIGQHILTRKTRHPTFTPSTSSKIRAPKWFVRIKFG